MTSQRNGFTLIELLIVVVIIGILASIAIPKFANTKDRANQATMKSDLRNLASAQEAYFNDNNSTYAANVTDLGTNYHLSSGVTITLGGVTGSTWAATATHSASPKSCSLSAGGSASNEGTVICQ
jgi:prepilin-type N-terminal cleavage/methylation domain-containing protein